MLCRLAGRARPRRFCAAFATATRPRAIEGGGGGKKGFKRFYDKVTVHAPAGGGDEAGAFWQVHLDGRVLKSPAKAPLRLPTEALATGVALEWDSMGEMIEPHLMPLFSAVSTVTDHLPDNRALYVSELKKYLDTCAASGPEPRRAHELQATHGTRSWPGCDTLGCGSRRRLRSASRRTRRRLWMPSSGT